MFKKAVLTLLALFTTASSFPSIDIICTHSSKNISFVGYQADKFYPLSCFTQNAELDSIINTIERKNTSLRVMVFLGMEPYFPGNELSMAYDVLARRGIDNTFNFYCLGSGGEKHPMGLVLYYNNGHRSWQEIKNLIEYGIANIDSIKKYQKWICKKYNHEYYDPVTDEMSDSIQVDTAGVTMNRALLQSIASGIYKGLPTPEPPHVQTLMNNMYALRQLCNMYRRHSQNYRGRVMRYFIDQARTFRYTLDDIVIPGHNYCSCH